MSNEEKDVKQQAPQQNAPLAQQAKPQQMALDDARRVKVLSPGMLVFKRFIRNKLAVLGIIILVVMFIFAFIGPIFSPYKEAEKFFKDVQEPGKYATGKYISDPRFVGDASSSMQSAILKALGTQRNSSTNKYTLTAGQEIAFEVKNEQYTLRVINPDESNPTCGIFATKYVAQVVEGELTYSDGTMLDAGLEAAILANAEAGGKEKSFTYNGSTVYVESSKVDRKYYVASDEPVALAYFSMYVPTLGKVADLQADPTFLNEVSKAAMAGNTSVDYEGKTYTLSGDAVNGYLLSGPDNSPLFNIERENRFFLVDVTSTDKDGNEVTQQVDFSSTVEDMDAYLGALNEALDTLDTTDTNASSFSYGEDEYAIEKTETEIRVTNSSGDLVLVISNSFEPVQTKYDTLSEDLDFCFALETAVANKAAGFDYKGERYTLVIGDDGDRYVKNAAGEEILLVSDIAQGADYVGIELTVDFIKKLHEAMRNNDDAFTFVNQYGEETDATITIVNGNYYVSTMQKTSLLDQRAAPNGSHWLGTDVHGMDVFTRLMYGGRVSLIVGFVVVFFEIFLGVLVGGVSGFFGGVVDTILMRFVELFNAIPFYPMLIILGSVMDAQHVDSYSRLMMTMAILGILGWTPIARLVRGQILSLREQDFMIAAEATGIRTSRRIFRHLIPNVMPLLIVNATSSLGGIILTEATLGFLGLGVKYPMASWGSIITQVNDMQVMKTAWWIWIPAGLFIMTTVLGFNFVGDGLRDAFDPKMKR